MGKGDFGQAKQSGVHDRLVKHLEPAAKRTDVIPAKTSEGEFRGTAKRGSSDFRARWIPAPDRSRGQACAGMTTFASAHFATGSKQFGFPSRPWARRGGDDFLRHGPHSNADLISAGIGIALRRSGSSGLLCAHTRISYAVTCLKPPITTAWPTSKVLSFH